jgi:hypothetical protein
MPQLTCAADLAWLTIGFVAGFAIRRRLSPAFRRDLHRYHRPGPAPIR